MSTVTRVDQCLRQNCFPLGRSHHARYGQGEIVTNDGNEMSDNVTARVLDSFKCEPLSVSYDEKSTHFCFRWGLIAMSYCLWFV